MVPSFSGGGPEIDCRFCRFPSPPAVCHSANPCDLSLVADTGVVSAAGGMTDGCVDVDSDADGICWLVARTGPDPELVFWIGNTGFGGPAAAAALLANVI